MRTRWNGREPSEGELELENLDVEVQGFPAGFPGVSSGRWIRKGSRLIVLGVERVPPGAMRGELPQELFETSQPTLRRGSTGEAVKELQRQLKQAGVAPGPIDGIFGQLTDSAVRVFQQSRRLAVDGIVGPNTWGELLSSTPGVPVTPAPSTDRWVLPDGVRARGDAQSVRYDAPPPWSGERGCTGQFTPGAAALRQYILATFRGVSEIWGYDCRQNTGNLAETSVHGTGRALDIMIPTLGGRANSAVGDPIANWLVRNASAIGVQLIIWNKTSWGSHHSIPKERPYTGLNPHTDHIHVELNRDGADRATPWFSSHP